MRVVAPGEAVRARDDRSCRWPHLAAKAEGIRLEWYKIAARADDLVFVDGSFPEARCEKLPEAAIDTLAHGMAASVPLIEVAHYGDALRLRRPYGEEDSIDAFVGGRMSAEAFIKPLVRAFDQQVIVERTESRAKSIGVEKVPAVALLLGVEPVGEAVLFPGDQALEEIALAAPFEVQNRTVGLDQRLQARDAWNESSDHHPFGQIVQPENGKGVRISRGDNARHVLIACTPAHTGCVFFFFFHADRAGTRHMSSVYSLIVRSDENQPARAVFSMAERHQDLRSRQRISASLCAAQ